MDKDIAELREDCRRQISACEEWQKSVNGRVLDDCDVCAGLKRFLELTA